MGYCYYYQNPDYCPLTEYSNPVWVFSLIRATDIVEPDVFEVRKAEKVLNIHGFGILLRKLNKKFK